MGHCRVPHMKKGTDAKSVPFAYAMGALLELADLSHVGEVGRGDLALELDGEAGVAGGCDGEIALLDEAELLGRLDGLHDSAVDGALGNLGLE